MNADKRLNWEGDSEFVAKDMNVPLSTFADAKLMLETCRHIASKNGINPDYGATVMAAMIGPCSNCGDWMSDRRLIAFEPSNPRAFGSDNGEFRTFYFSLCADCKRASSNAEQRAWARTMAVKMASGLIGADGPKQ